MYRTHCPLFKWEVFLNVPGKPQLRPILVQPEDPSIKHIALTKGQIAIVDADKYEYLNQWPWCASWSKHTKSFYAIRNDRSNGKHTTVKMHREVLGLKVGDGIKCDHVEPSKTLDNRICNLRIANFDQNAHNRRPNAKSSSSFKGCTWYPKLNKWMSSIRVKGKKLHLGYHASEESAHAAYTAAAAVHFGEFARSKN
jgi:AP2 domain